MCFGAFSTVVITPGVSKNDDKLIDDDSFVREMFKFDSETDFKGFIV